MDTRSEIYTNTYKYTYVEAPLTFHGKQPMIDLMVYQYCFIQCSYLTTSLATAPCVQEPACPN
jgi:hypothetical protein